MSDGFNHPSHADQRFTADGGYVLQQSSRDGAPMLLAVTAGDSDLGVALQPHEAVDIARWLLREVLEPDDWGIVGFALEATRWAAQERLADQDDARSSIDR